MIEPGVALARLAQATRRFQWLPSVISAPRDPGFGHNVPWSKKKTNRRWSPNIQRVRATVNGAPKRLNVCTSCLKAGKVTR